MITIRFLAKTVLVLLILYAGRAYAAGNYVVSYTNGRNDVGFFELTDDGRTFTAGTRFFVTSNTRIGTTSPELIKVNGISQMWVHHTFAGSNILPVYGIAKFLLQTGQLAQLLSVPNFLIQRYDVLNITGPCCFGSGQARTLNSKKGTLDISTAILSANTGVPGGRKIVFNNGETGDVVYGSTISRDATVSIQSVLTLKGPVIGNQIQARKVLNGAGTGNSIVVSSGLAAFTPALTNGPSNRLLAYRVFRNVGMPSQQSKILVQQLNGTTLQAVGAPIPITGFIKAQVSAEAAHSVALPEDGSFILYSRFNNGCKKQTLIIQRLSGARKVGGPKLLIGCNALTDIPVGFYGIDIEAIRIL